MPSYIQRHKTMHFHSIGNAWFLLAEALPQAPVTIMFWVALPFGHRLRNCKLLSRNQSLFAYRRLSEYWIGVTNKRNDLYADSTSSARINEMAKSSTGNHDQTLCIDYGHNNIWRIIRQDQDAVDFHHNSGYSIIRLLDMSKMSVQKGEGK